MIKSNKFSIGKAVFASAIALTSVSLIIGTGAFAAQPKVDLGNSESFVVLGGSGITNPYPAQPEATWDHPPLHH